MFLKLNPTSLYFNKALINSFFWCKTPEYHRKENISTVELCFKAQSRPRQNIRGEDL